MLACTMNPRRLSLTNRETELQAHSNYCLLMAMLSKATQQPLACTHIECRMIATHLLFYDDIEM